METEHVRPERRQESVGELLKDLRDETQTLVRKEAELARVEMRQKMRLAMRQMAYIGIGAVFLLAGLIEVLAALNRGLTAWFVEGMGVQVAVWLAPLVVAVVFLAVGSMVVAKGMHTLRDDTRPEHTQHSLQKMKRWAKSHTSERRTA